MSPLRVLFSFIGGAVVVLITFAASLYIFGAWHDEWSGFNASMRVSDGVCNIAIIPVHGEIGSYSYFDEMGTEVITSTLDDFIYLLRSAEQDPNIDGVVVSIDSPGGSPYAGEAMANELKRFPLPTAVVVRDTAASTGYWAATGADTIIASALSDIGSIGITMSYLEYAQQNQDAGLYFLEIASAPHKDAGNPDRFLTAEEEAIFEAHIKMNHDEFVRQVAENRDLPLEQVQAFADGLTVPGPVALQEGLIDQIGDKETARAWFASTLDLPIEDVILCE